MGWHTVTRKRSGRVNTLVDHAPLELHHHGMRRPFLARSREHSPTVRCSVLRIGMWLRPVHAQKGWLPEKGEPLSLLLGEGWAGLGAPVSNGSFVLRGRCHVERPAVEAEFVHVLVHQCGQCGTAPVPRGLERQQEKGPAGRRLGLEPGHHL